MLARKSLFEVLQKIGRATMLPVSILPVAGILLGLGGALLAAASRGALPVDSQGLIVLLQIMKSAGEAIFANLPLLFAIGVTLGLTENDGTSAMAAIVGFVVLQGTIGVTSVGLGLASIDTGVFGGILVGYITARLFNRFHRIELPTYLGFFNGKRFVPIVTAFAMIALGLALSLLWPTLQRGIDGFSQFASVTHPALASFIYGVGERALLPFGLHHIWNVPFFFQAGDFTTATGEIVHGEIPRFFSGDPTAGILAGGFLYKMWGLPAAALAMWQTAKPEQKARVGTIMLSAALASFLTGITEPIEFSFLFIAPVLYGAHAVLAGLCFPLLYFLQVRLGFTFSQGFIDYGLFYILDTRPWMILLLGPVVALFYYWVFKIVILKFNLQTPGREIVDAAKAGVLTPKEMAEKLLAAMGGKANLQSLDACISRLRIGLVDPKKADSEAFKQLGASGVMVVGNNLQVVFGTRSESLKSDIQDLIGKNLAPGSTVIADPLVDALGGVGNIKSLELVAGTRLRVLVNQGSLVNEGALKVAGALAVTKVNEFSYHLILGARAPDDYRRLSALIVWI